MSNPLWHPPFTVIPGINPDDPISLQLEQLDQLNTYLLQDIDESFSNLHQILTTRLLPAIKQFDAANEPTKDAAKFWRSFFEAAAFVEMPNPNRVAAPSASRDTSSSSRHRDMSTSLVHDSSSASQRSASQAESSFLAGLEGIGSSTPLPTRSSVRAFDESAAFDEEDSGAGGFMGESPAERLSRLLKADIEADQSGSSTSTIGERGQGGSLAASSSSLLHSGRNPPPKQQKQQQQKQQEDEYDSDMDSPDQSFADAYVAASDTPRAASAPAPVVQGFPTLKSSVPVPASRSTPKPTRSSSAAAGTSAAKVRRTPSNPFSTAATSTSQRWDGVADLGRTPLSVAKNGTRSYGFAPPDRGGSSSDSDSDDSLEGLLLPPGMSPPQTINFVLPPSSRAGAGTTGRFVPSPVKEAVPRVVAGALERGLGGGGPSRDGTGAVAGGVAGGTSFLSGLQSRSMPTPQRNPPIAGPAPAGFPGGDLIDQHSATRSTASGYISSAALLSQQGPNPNASFSDSDSDSDDSEGDLSMSHLPSPPKAPYVFPASFYSSSSSSSHPEASLLPPPLPPVPYASSSSSASVPRPPSGRAADDSFDSDSDDDDDSRFVLPPVPSLSEPHHLPQQPQPFVPFTSSSSSSHAQPLQPHLRGKETEDDTGEHTAREAALISFDGLATTPRSDPAAGAEHEYDLFRPQPAAGGAQGGAGAAYVRGLQQPRGGGGAGAFGLLGADEMFTFNGGRLEDAPPGDSPTPLGGALGRKG